MSYQKWLAIAHFQPTFTSFSGLGTGIEYAGLHNTRPNYYDGPHTILKYILTKPHGCEKSLEQLLLYAHIQTEYWRCNVPRGSWPSRIYVLIKSKVGHHHLKHTITECRNVTHMCRHAIPRSLVPVSLSGAHAFGLTEQHGWVIDYCQCWPWPCTRASTISYPHPQSVKHIFVCIKFVWNNNE